ncbi:SMP-30/gluconolactonase/LRE family protein [Pseudactinotalea sp.]|uniref:SMP-30/gluconolactonase/LRE family protein n=1 Tax=Pseudactinotalea sp. TaxID=1926260 RepID=UPI003B3B17D7
MDIEVDLVLDSRAHLGEGPVWDEDAQELVWVNLIKGEVHRFDPATGTDRGLDVGTPVGAAALRSSGGFVLAVENGFATLSETGDLTPLVDLGLGPTHRANDGKCDRFGRFWAGTNAYDFTPGESTLWRLDADGSASAVVTGLTLANGLDWSPDDTTMYLIDTVPGVWAFDFESTAGAAGTLSGARALVTFAEGELPDGMTVDAQGYLWVAMYSGGEVRRYAPDGALAGRIPVPVANPSSCAFGGPDLRDLYITTGHQLDDPTALDPDNHLGSLFRCRPGVAGLPAGRYSG